jgi:hypothetical protein
MGVVDMRRQWIPREPIRMVCFLWQPSGHRHHNSRSAADGGDRGRERLERCVLYTLDVGVSERVCTTCQMKEAGSQTTQLSVQTTMSVRGAINSCIRKFKCWTCTAFRGTVFACRSTCSFRVPAGVLCTRVGPKMEMLSLADCSRCGLLSFFNLSRSEKTY